MLVPFDHSANVVCLKTSPDSFVFTVIVSCAAVQLLDDVTPFMAYICKVERHVANGRRRYNRTLNIQLVFDIAFQTVVNTST